VLTLIRISIRVALDTDFSKENQRQLIFFEYGKKTRSVRNAHKKWDSKIINDFKSRFCKTINIDSKSRSGTRFRRLRKYSRDY